MNIKVMFSKNSDDWKTPNVLYKTLMEKGYIDPCPYQAKEDGLQKKLFYEKALY